MAAAIEAARTPDELFADVPGFPFAPHYLEHLAGFEGLRVHYLDERPAGVASGRSPGAGFDAWKAFVASRPDFDIPNLMKRSCPHLSDAEAAAYAAPFPDRTYRAGPRVFPALVPVDPRNGRGRGQGRAGSRDQEQGAMAGTAA